MIVRNPQFINAAKNSMRAYIIATIISVALAFGAAWSVARTGIRFKGDPDGLDIRANAGSFNLSRDGVGHSFGSNGISQIFLGLNGSIYGFWGIVAGSALYSFPVAFLMLLDVLKYEDTHRMKWQLF